LTVSSVWPANLVAFSVCASECVLQHHPVDGARGGGVSADAHPKQVLGSPKASDAPDDWLMPCYLQLFLLELAAKYSNKPTLAAQ
jgi:hypothetical protein